MGKASKKRYDGKHRVTRIFLDDYRVVKGWAELAGISMAEALHKFITRQPLPAPQLKPRLVMPILADKVTASMAIGYRPQPAVATNGKAIAFRIKQRGVRYD